MKRFLLLSCLATQAACGAQADVDEGEIGVATSALAEGTREAWGVLTFLNSPATTVQVLDVTVGLDSRAARNIVDHVVAKHDPIDSIAELDAIPYVGPTAIQKILDHVKATGGVPDQLVENVPFSNAEAAAVLAAANGAAQAELDAHLDSRAAANIVAARPLRDLAALAAVSYVGATALQRLKAWAPGWTPSCQPHLSGRGDANAVDWNGLLEEATSGDFGPYGRVLAFEATPCTDTAAFTGLVRSAMAGEWATPDAPVQVGASAQGGTSFASSVATMRDALDERVADGRWDPAGNAAWARRDAIQAALTGPAAQAPASFVQITLSTDAEECSESAVGLLDLRSGVVLITHILPRC